MMEGTAEPTVCVVFSPRQPEQVRHAIRIVDRFIALNCALFELVEEIQAGRLACRYIYRSGRTIASSCMRLC
jgi:hypothetical protein